jgi:hypothetical protein
MLGLSLWERCFEIQGHVRLAGRMSCSQEHERCEVGSFVYSSWVTLGQASDSEHTLGCAFMIPVP